MASVTEQHGAKERVVRDEIVARTAVTAQDRLRVGVRTLNELADELKPTAGVRAC